MSTPTRPTFQPQRRGGGFSRFLRHLQTVALIGTTLVIAYWFWSGGKPNPFGQAPPPTPTFTPESAQNVELATVASVQRQQLIAAKLKQRQVIAAFDELARDLREWEKEIAAWQRVGPTILSGEDGKKLAADEVLVRQARTILKGERPGAEAITAAKKQAEELIFPIRESLSNAEDASSPSDFATTTFRELQSQARNAREQYRQAREGLSVLLAQAPAAGQVTLGQAIASLDREEIRKRFATIEAAESKAREDGVKLVAEEKAKLIQTEKDAEAQKLRDETAKKKQASDMAAAKSVEEMEYKQKEAAQEIDRLRDVAELKRQGLLITGSVWKGSLYQNSDYECTLTIASRVKDDVQVTLKRNKPGDGGGTYSYSGKIKGNTIRLSEQGSTEVDLEATLNPSAQAITGKINKLPPTTFSLRLHKDE